MTPHTFFGDWSFDPGVSLALVVAGWLYACGQRRLRRRSPVIALYFWCGWLVVALALVSPIDAGSRALLSIHMTQHLLLGLVAPLLLVAGRPVPTMRRGLPRSVWPGAQLLQLRLRRFGVARHAWAAAGIALVVHIGGFWLWHVPVLYDAAIEHGAIHAIEHVTLLAGGVALWGVVGRARWNHRTGVAVILLFACVLGSGVLAALLTLSPRPLYTSHLATAAPWHLSPLEDQQLAGALMWVPGGLVYAVAATITFIRWLDAGPPSAATPWDYETVRSPEVVA